MRKELKEKHKKNYKKMLGLSLSPLRLTRDIFEYLEGNKRWLAALTLPVTIPATCVTVAIGGVYMGVYSLLILPCDLLDYEVVNQNIKKNIPDCFIANPEKKLHEGSLSTTSHLSDSMKKAMKEAPTSSPSLSSSSRAFSEEKLSISESSDMFEFRKPHRVLNEELMIIINNEVEDIYLNSMRATR